MKKVLFVLFSALVAVSAHALHRTMPMEANPQIQVQIIPSPVNNAPNPWTLVFQMMTEHPELNHATYTDRHFPLTLNYTGEKGEIAEVSHDIRSGEILPLGVFDDKRSEGFSVALVTTGQVEGNKVPVTVVYEIVNGTTPIRGTLKTNVEMGKSTVIIQDKTHALSLKMG